MLSSDMVFASNQPSQHSLALSKMLASDLNRTAVRQKQQGTYLQQPAFYPSHGKHVPRKDV